MEAEIAVDLARAVEAVKVEVVTNAEATVIVEVVIVVQVIVLKNVLIQEQDQADQVQDLIAVEQIEKINLRNGNLSISK